MFFALLSCMLLIQIFPVSYTAWYFRNHAEYSAMYTACSAHHFTDFVTYSAVSFRALFSKIWPGPGIVCTLMVFRVNIRNSENNIAAETQAKHRPSVKRRRAVTISCVAATTGSVSDAESSTVWVCMRLYSGIEFLPAQSSLGRCQLVRSPRTLGASVSILTGSLDWQGMLMLDNISQMILICSCAWLRGAMAARSTPDRKVGGSIPSGVTFSYLSIIIVFRFCPPVWSCMIDP